MNSQTWEHPYPNPEVLLLLHRYAFFSALFLSDLSSAKNIITT